MSSRFPIILATLMLTFQVSPAADAPNPAKPPGAAEITKIEQVLTEVPRDVLRNVQSGPTKEKSATEATDSLRTKVEGRTATLKFKVDKVEKYQRKNEKEDRYRIKAEDLRVRDNVIALKGYLWVHLDLSENAKVPAIKKGSQISVTGKVSVATITSKATPELHVDLSDATIN